MSRWEWGKLWEIPVARSSLRQTCNGRKIPFLLASVLIFLILLPSSATEALASNQKKTQWHLKQRDQSTGIHDFYFCPTAVKILDKARGYSIVSTAPDWDVVLFRADDKVFCRQKRSQYYYNMGFKQKTIFGPPVVLTTKRIGPVTAPLIYGAYHNDAIKKFSGVPQQVGDLISCYYKMGCVPGIRLRVVSNKVPDRSKVSLGAELFLSAAVDPSGVTLETMSLTEMPYDEATFKIPAGLQLVKDVKQIKTGMAKRKEAEAIFLDMGVGDELGKVKNKGKSK